jgi:hypothetical protein
MAAKIRKQTVTLEGVTFTIDGFVVLARPQGRSYRCPWASSAELTSLMSAPVSMDVEIAGLGFGHVAGRIVHESALGFVHH